MGYLIEGFMRNARGGITSRRFDSTQFPSQSEGWYDSPSKVPELPGKVVAEKPPVKASQSEATISANLGTHDPQPLGREKLSLKGKGRR